MNSCEKFQDMFDEYIDGTLSKADEVQLKEHLESCALCREELAFLEKMEEELHALPMAPLPDHFSSALREKLEKEPIPQKSKVFFLNHWGKYGSALSAAAAIALIILFGHGDLGSHEQPSGDIIPTSDPMHYASPVQPTTAPLVATQSPAPVATQQPAATKRPSTGYNAPRPTANPNPDPVYDQNNRANTSESKVSGGGSAGSSGSSSGSGANTGSQGLMFVIHGTVDSATLKQLQAIPTFQVVGGNWYQMQRSYQNQLIQALREYEYSIHFSSETSRVDHDSFIIELV